MLVVDDDPAVRILVQQSLESHGYIVRSAESGERAIELFPVIVPNLILLDINMSGIDGIETCRRIRTFLQGQLIPILILTGSDDLAAIDEAYEAGATDFITKPINWPILIHHVRYMLRAGQAIIDQQQSDQIQILLARLTEVGNQRFDSLEELFVKVLEVLLSDFLMTSCCHSGGVYLLKESTMKLIAHSGRYFEQYP